MAKSGSDLGGANGDSEQEQKSIELLKLAFLRKGKLDVRIDRRYNAYNYSLRFSANKMDELEQVRKAMAVLGFKEGTPQSSANSAYVPYYGKQVLTFARMIGVEVKYPPKC